MREGGRYPNGFEALKHINLTIDQGEFVAIIGLSGAGKSTLIRTINRMHDITQGQLTVDGTDVMTLHGKNLRKFRRRIGDPARKKPAEISPPDRHDFPVLQPDYPHHCYQECAHRLCP